MTQVDSGQLFTGGCEVTLVDNNGIKCAIGHISLENQPLRAFAEAVITEKKIVCQDFQVTAFDRETGKMRVMFIPVST